MSHTKFSSVFSRYEGSQRWRTSSATLLFLLATLSTIVPTTASAGDIVLDEGDWGEQLLCMSDVKSRYYTTRAATFVFDWDSECDGGDIQYEIEVERVRDSNSALDLLLGPGEPNWAEAYFSGICPGPCSVISMHVEHPWHEGAEYWFHFDVKGPPRAEYGGKYVRSWGSSATACGTNGVLAGCRDWTMHVPDSPEDIPKP